MLHQSMVDLYPSENFNAWNLLSVRHFVCKLLFHVHLPRFADILIWIHCSKHRSKSFPYLACCYFTCTCLVLEISLFGSIVVKQKQKHRSKFFIFGIQIHIWIGSAHHESIRKMPWRKRNQFSNTKSIVKVEAGIVTLISYRHYLKIVENPK